MTAHAVIPTPREGGGMRSSSQDYPWWYSKVKANRVSMRNCQNQEITSKRFYGGKKIIFLIPKQQRETAFVECVISNLSVFLGSLYMLFHQRNWGPVWTVFTPDLQSNEMLYIYAEDTYRRKLEPVYTPSLNSVLSVYIRASVFRLAVPIMESPFSSFPPLRSRVVHFYSWSCVCFRSQRCAAVLLWLLTGRVDMPGLYSKGFVQRSDVWKADLGSVGKNFCPLYLMT